MLKHVGNTWKVYNSTGTKLLGTHKSKAEALKQIAAIESSKAKRGK